jgi:hypothetical protein
VHLNLYHLQITKTDPIDGTETVVGEFYDISIEQANYIMLNWEMVEAFGLEYMESEDKGRLREY